MLRTWVMHECPSCKNKALVPKFQLIKKILTFRAICGVVKRTSCVIDIYREEHCPDTCASPIQRARAFGSLCRNPHSLVQARRPLAARSVVDAFGARFWSL